MYRWTWTMWPPIWPHTTRSWSLWTYGRRTFCRPEDSFRWHVYISWRSSIWAGGRWIGRLDLVGQGNANSLSNNVHSLREASLGDGLFQLLSNCPKLKKLFLSAVRGTTERDLMHIAALGKSLEQLDLMGILNITHERVYEWVSINYFS